MPIRVIQMDGVPLLMMFLQLLLLQMMHPTVDLWKMIAIVVIDVAPVYRSPPPDVAALADCVEEYYHHRRDYESDVNAA